jgi:hypothetical protein
MIGKENSSHYFFQISNKEQTPRKVKQEAADRVIPKIIGGSNRHDKFQLRQRVIE